MWKLKEHNFQIRFWTSINRFCQHIYFHFCIYFPKKKDSEAQENPTEVTYSSFLPKKQEIQQKSLREGMPKNALQTSQGLTPGEH